MIKYLELALSQEVHEYLEELDEMNWSARGNVLNQYLRNTSIGTTVNKPQIDVYGIYSHVHVAILTSSNHSITKQIIPRQRIHSRFLKE